MTYATLSLILLLGVLGYHKAHDDGGADVDDQDVGDDMAQIDLPQECAENEQLFYPGACPSHDDLSPEIFGCYIPCDLEDCPRGLICIEAVHNPCWEGSCASCSQTVKVCVEDHPDG